MGMFKYAGVTHGNMTELLSGCFEQLGDLKPEDNVGFIYVTDVLINELDQLMGQLHQRYPLVHWVGTLGMALCLTDKEVYESPAVAIMVGCFDAASFRLLPSFKGSINDLPSEVAKWWTQQDYCFGMIHADPANPDASVYLEKLSQEQENSFINGGLTSSHGVNTQFCDGLVSGALSGILFNQSVAVLTDHSQGCSPIGDMHVITDSEKNVLNKLNHRPAFEQMVKDVGQERVDNLDKMGANLFAAFPIEGSDTGDYTVRNLLGIDPEGGRIAIGEMLDDKRQMMFCFRDNETAVVDMQAMLKRLKKRVAGGSIRGAVYVSCLGRGRYQFGEQSQELLMIKNVLGDFPLVGFFANGEIYNGRLYGYTGVLTLFL